MCNKRRIRSGCRRLLGGGASMRDCGYGALSVLSCLCPCFRRCRSTRYQSLAEDEEASDHKQIKADFVGIIMMFVSLVLFVLLLIKFSLGLGKLDVMDEYTRNLPLILYATILEILICGASARTAALLYRQRRHVVKHPNEINSNVYVRVGPVTRTNLRTSWGFTYRPSNDGLEALIVEDVYTNSTVSIWNSQLNEERARDLENKVGKAILSHSNELKEAREFGLEVENKENIPNKSNKYDDDLVEVDLRVKAGQPDEIQPKEKVRLYSGYAIIAVNDVHGDVGLMQQELLTADTVTLYCHCHLADPTLDERDEIYDENVNPVSLGATTVVPSTTGEVNHKVSCAGLEDEEPQMMLRWLICSFAFGWVSLLPVMLVDPHPLRPRQRLFREVMLPACCLIIPIWVGLWVLDVVSILLHKEFIPVFWYYVGLHMGLAGLIVFLAMRLQQKDLEIVDGQREQRRKEVAEGDGEKSAKVRDFICEDAPPTLLRELLISNPVAIVFIGSLVAFPLFISQILFPLKSARGKLAQTYICISFGILSVLQGATVWFLWQITFENLPRLYLAGFGVLIWYPFFIGYCCCLVFSGHYAKRDLNLIKKQRKERAAEYGVSGPGMVELMETRSKEWELVFSM